MSSYVKIKERPKCDLPDCENKAYGDFKTVTGGWANLCRPHAMVLANGVGTGMGQIFIVDGEKHPDECPCPECTADYKAKKLNKPSGKGFLGRR